MRHSIFSVLDHYPSRSRSIADLYAEVLGQIDLADRLSYDTVFVAEHHFHEYGVFPNPAVALAAAAMRTRRVRLAPAVAVLPFHDVRRVAEDYAMLDLLSGGRVVLGVGSGYLKHEFEGFGVDPACKRDRFDETLEVLERLLRGERVTHHGRFVHLDDVQLNVAPGRMPDTYVAALRREAAYFVGKAGRRMMTVPYASVDRFDEIGEMMAEYARGCSEGGHTGDAVIALHTYVAADDATARAEAAEAFDLYVATRLYAKSQTYDDIMRSGLSLMGGIDTVVDKMVRLHAMGVRHVTTLHNFGALDDALVRASMTRFDQEVMPRVRERIAVTA